MPATAAVATLPARSSAVPLAVWPAPSAERRTGGGHVATPESASAQVKLTTTSALFQPSAFEGVRLAAIVGAVRSTLTLATVVLATLPARSIAVPDVPWLAPSVAIVTGPPQVATPARSSPHVN